jgi:nucleoside-diphosphate-sugar epimerase
VRVFLAGATGAVGLPLARALCTQGHGVVGMTRAGAGVERLRELGAEASVADAFDAKAVLSAIEAVTPDVVIDQLTWLPASPADVLKSLPDDTRLRRDGGANLLAAAKAVGVRRYVMQSRGFYLEAPEGRLADENAKLRYGAPGEVGTSARVTGDYEERVLNTPSLDGTVLRYGFFCGPGTWYRPDGAVAEQLRRGDSTILGDGNGVWSFVHIDDAVAATVAALTAEPGVYNVVDDDPLPVAAWLPAFAQWVGAPEPRRVTREEALATAGEEAVYYHTRLSGRRTSAPRRRSASARGRCSGSTGTADRASRHRSPAGSQSPPAPSSTRRTAGASATCSMRWTASWSRKTIVACPFTPGRRAVVLPSRSRSIGYGRSRIAGIANILATSLGIALMSAT